ncbi:uncharacterized protein LOC136032608 [Artemia franciscana]|uniref:uncharacterized protein LOC136032608 n=1 Tax=Artemia franciscana TaxID=6661 RepID=UPI0032DB04DF
MWFALFCDQGDTCKAENYRPIGLTSAVAKVTERIINDRPFQHFVNNDIISNRQHDFLPGKPVETNLLETYEGLPVGLILLDIIKAFEEVPNNWLCSKLTAARISQELAYWLMDFLAGRSLTAQLFTTDGKCTYLQPCKILSGVPHGTALGPTLFLLLI